MLRLRGRWSGSGRSGCPSRRSGPAPPRPPARGAPRPRGTRSPQRVWREHPPPCRQARQKTPNQHSPGSHFNQTLILQEPEGGIPSGARVLDQCHIVVRLAMPGWSVWLSNWEELVRSELETTKQEQVLDLEERSRT